MAVSGSGMLTDGLNQAAGNIEKAIIEIEDQRGRKPVSEPPVAAEGSARGPLTFESPVSLIPGAGSLAGNGNSGLSLAEQAAAAVSAANPAGQGGAPQPPTKKQFYVQFNPSELILSGYGGGYTAKTDFSDSGSSITLGALDARISLNVKLIFDKADPQDAFMADKFNLAPTAVGTGLVKAKRSARGEKNNSVQGEVEGFIAALRSKYTRSITFLWGDMVYQGILNRVSAQYTMFNVVGEPVRATVELSLVCTDQNVSAASMGTWQAQYEKAFGSRNQSYVKAAQKAGNLLNFNL